MPNPAALELVALTKRYGTTTAVDAINLRIAAGTYCCLLGPSGCGKSSTLRMIAGHEAASEGDIILGNQNVTDLPPARRGTAMMFQSYALFPHLTVLDNVAFALKMRGVDKATRRRRASELLDLVAMTPYAGRLPTLSDAGLVGNDDPLAGFDLIDGRGDRIHLQAHERIVKGVNCVVEWLRHPSPIRYNRF